MKYRILKSSKDRYFLVAKVDDFWLVNPEAFKSIEELKYRIKEGIISFEVVEEFEL